MNPQPKIGPLAPVKSVPASRARLSFRPKAGAWILLLVVGYIVLTMAGLAFRIYGIKQDLNTLSMEKERLLEQNEALRQEIADLNDPLRLEQLAREKLLMVKPGEKLLLPGVPGEVKPLDPEAAAEEKRD